MLVTLIYYIRNAASTEKNLAPAMIYRRNFTCRTLEKGLGFRVCSRRFGYIMSRRYEHRVSTLKTKSVPSIFTLNFYELTYGKGFRVQSFKSMLVTATYYFITSQTLPPPRKTLSPPRSHARTFTCRTSEKGLACKACGLQQTFWIYYVPSIRTSHLDVKNYARVQYSHLRFQRSYASKRVWGLQLQVNARNTAPARIYRRNFTYRTLEKGLRFRVCSQPFGQIMSRRNEPRASTIQNKRVPSIFTLNF